MICPSFSLAILVGVTHVIFNDMENVFSVMLDFFLEVDLELFIQYNLNSIYVYRNQTKKKSTKMFIWLSVDKFAWFLLFPNLTV